MNILIMGLMGSGKTTLAKLLAYSLQTEAIESDSLILQRTDHMSVQDVYEERVSLWKENELKVMKRLSVNKNQVIVCGGGIIENDLNFQYFRENSPKTLIVYLQASPTVLAKRLTLAHPEYSLGEMENIIKRITYLFEKRDTIYQNIANLVINTDEKLPEEILGIIQKHLQSQE